MTGSRREQLLFNLENSLQQVSDLLESMAVQQDWQSEPNEWSFRYMAAYLVAVEQECFSQRVRQIASGDNPHLTAYRNTGWDFMQQDLQDSLKEWAAVRVELLNFVRTLSSEKLLFTGTHDIYGTMTTLDALDEILKHDREQVRHINVLIEDYRENALV